MRIGWAIACRYVEVHDNLATIIGGGIDRVAVPTMPSPAPVQILCAVRIVASHDEVTEEPEHEPQHTLVCRVHDPSMALVSELPQPFGMSGQTADPTVEPAAILPVGVVFQPEEEGQSTIEIAVDDRAVSFPLIVIVGAPPQA